MKIWLAALILAAFACGGSSIQEVEGALIGLEGGITAVEQFTIVKPDGSRLRFIPGPNATFHGGPLGHLRDHLRVGSSIVVQYRVEGDVLIALEVDDA